jgi:DNA-binding CsgD family transcriptional regulator
MRNGLKALTEREKETLRLLLGGHDAKSIARAQRLSVHTVNERLRDARRKLDVSSSREAARMLAQAEQPAPDNLGDELFGVAGGAGDRHRHGRPEARRTAVRRLAWFGGGIFIMSIIIVAMALSPLLQGGKGTETHQAAVPASTAAAAPGAQSAEVAAAREWVSLLDAERWGESWRDAADMFRSQISAAQWASSVAPVRKPLGRATSRALQSAARSTSLPGAPAGEYEIVQFQTNFAHKSGAIETVVLARETAGWKVAGYFVK